MWLVVFFFAPFINLLFFVVLGVLPSQPQGKVPMKPLPPRQRSFVGRVIPDHPVGSAAISLVIVVSLGVASTLLGVSGMGNYGWGLFVGVPFTLGLISVLLYGYHQPRSYKACCAVALLSVALLGAALVAFAVEGAICLVMAAPIAVALALIGGTVGYFLQIRPENGQNVPPVLMGLFIAVPLLMGAERAQSPESSLIAVRTAVDVNAPPAQVWKHVVAFAELPPPQEWLFRIGIAYPMRAEIEGRGVGAVRRCVFSTGAFVEPIEVWDEPRLLKFSVTSNPPPMQEWTPYAQIHPPHLDGFLVSEGGQFRLTPLPNGRTRLQGTTWYRHNMFPASYWKVWSDVIIHRIHLRVLHHVKGLSEKR
jgi:hypothetical protein